MEVEQDVDVAAGAQTRDKSTWHRVHHSLEEVGSFPHGLWSAAALVLLTAAEVLTLIASWSCNFLQDEDNDNYHIGIFRGRIGDKCEAITDIHVDLDNDNTDDIKIDKHWKQARAFACMASIGGFVAFLIMALSPCIAYKTRFIRFVAFWCLLFAVFDALTFSMKEIDLCEKDVVVGGIAIDVCDDLGPGAKNMVAAVVLWFVTSVVMVFIPPFEEKPRRIAPGLSDEEEASKEAEDVEVADK